MALDKTTFKNSIISMMESLKDAENQTDAIETFATELSNAVETFVKLASVYATPTDVTGAVMTAGGNAVIASNNLNCNIE